MLRHAAPHAALNRQGLRHMLRPARHELATRALAAIACAADQEWAEAEDNGDDMGYRDWEIEEEARDAGYGFASDEEEDALPPHDAHGLDDDGSDDDGLSSDEDDEFDFSSDEEPGYAEDEIDLLLDDPYAFEY
jgi:hypothetical protein